MRRVSVILAAVLCLSTVVFAAEKPAFDPEKATLVELESKIEELLRTGDENGVADLVAVADRRFPDSQEFADYRLSLLYRATKYEDALAFATEILKAHPDWTAFLYSRMQLESMLGREAEALATADKIIAATGDSVAYAAKGDIYIRSTKPDYEAARKAYEAGLATIAPEERPERADVIYNLGCCYARLGNAAKAITLVREAVSFDPELASGIPDDADLLSLAGNAEFDKFMAEMRTAAEAQALEMMTVKPGTAAPAFSLADLAGAKHSPAEFKGKPLVLNIWATWCPPCRAEIPDLVAFAQAHPEIMVVGVSVDEPDADLKQFIMDYDISYLILRGDEATAKQYLGASGGIPQTYFIDAEGVVRGHIYGSAPRDTFEARLRDLPAEKK
jgi:tetratricopeptide (TPR) repeat protein